jgi:hypothetical protein
MIQKSKYHSSADGQSLNSYYKRLLLTLGHSFLVICDRHCGDRAGFYRYFKSPLPAVIPSTLIIHL